MSATITAPVADAARTEPGPRRSPRRRIDWGQPFVYLVALVIAAVAIGPVLYVFIGGFRTTPDLNADPAGLPDPWTIENWALVLGSPRFWGNVLSSMILAFGTTAGVVIVGVMAAFVIARYIGFFWRILLPLSMPGLVTVGVLAFVGSWNGYLLPLLVISTGTLPQEFWPLPLGVTQFSTQYSQDTGAVLAYTSLAMLPALAFFLFAEKRIVGGLTGAVKG